MNKFGFALLGLPKLKKGFFHQRFYFCTTRLDLDTLIRRSKHSKGLNFSRLLAGFTPKNKSVNDATDFISNPIRQLHLQAFSMHPRCWGRRADSGLIAQALLHSHTSSGGLWAQQERL